jgi:hypothetical protein
LDDVAEWELDFVEGGKGKTTNESVVLLITVGCDTFVVNLRIWRL